MVYPPVLRATKKRQKPTHGVNVLYVHPKKKREKKKTTRVHDKTRRKQTKNKRRRRKERPSKANMRSGHRPAEPRRHGFCLLVRSLVRTCPAGGPTWTSQDHQTDKSQGVGSRSGLESGSSFRLGSRCWFVLPRYPTVFGASKQSGLDSGGDPAAVVLSRGGQADRTSWRSKV